MTEEWQLRLPHVCDDLLIMVSSSHHTSLTCCWAVQASLEETQSEQKQTAYAAELLRPGGSHEPASTSTMGLRNATGEYNCFLNVIIQCMWHCHAFRQAVMGWDPAAYQVQLHHCPHHLHCVVLPHTLCGVFC